MAGHFVHAISNIANRKPKSLAITDGATSVTYSALDNYGVSVAARLKDIGCLPGDRVVMLAGRRAETLAAIVGIFRAGCVHVPLDPGMPISRLRYVLDDVRPTVIIVDEQHRSTFDGMKPEGSYVIHTVELMRIMTSAISTEQAQGGISASHCTDSDVAYCIYTSGSTGRPKGVLIEHKSISSFFEGAQEVYDVSENSRCASFSPLHFDAFLFDMLFPLSRGAHVHLYGDVVSPDAIFEFIHDNAITHFSAWGVMLSLITQAIEFHVTPLPSLRTVLTGSDVPDVKTVQKWLSKSDGLKVINGYGPTEATCAVAAHVIKDIEPERRELYPIGAPLKNVRLMLVDEDGGEIDCKNRPGELLAGGAQVMQGYWRMPDETRKKTFLKADTRFYRTGDLCKYLEDGSLYYIGRKDDEVNIGGYRVHLNEVRRVIDIHHEVCASETVLIDSEFGEKILASAVLLDPMYLTAQEKTVAKIRARLLEELPIYMVPRFVVSLTEFPLLSSGKCDRKTLKTTLSMAMRSATREVMNQ